MGDSSRPSDSEMQRYHIQSLLGGRPQSTPDAEVQMHDLNDRPAGPRSAQEMIRRQMAERGPNGRA